jgi:peptide/nickel transport system ATP-binding protein
MSRDPEVVCRVEGLRKYFPIEKGFLRRVVGYVRAVDDVSFTVRRGENLGLVGESGCGKTTTARMIARALLPTQGRIEITTPSGVVDMGALRGRALREQRRHVQMVFQDPFGSLDPRMTVLDIISEPLSAYGMSRRECRERVAELLDLVGLNPDYMGRYPHAFSGGQRQRIGFARACALDPVLLVADEPVSALDVSVQAQVLNLIKRIQQQRLGTSLFITHDLAVVRYVCERVVVMYEGLIVEVAETVRLFAKPYHPYTELLIQSVPDADPTQEWLSDVPELDASAAGEPVSIAVSPDGGPAGCPFAPRCRFVEDRCHAELPPLREIEPGRLVRCRRADEIALQGVGR